MPILRSGEEMGMEYMHLLGPDTDPKRLKVKEAATGACGSQVEAQGSGLFKTKA